VLARLSSPHIVRFIASFRDDTHLNLVMEFVEGVRLQSGRARANGPL